MWIDEELVQVVVRVVFFPIPQEKEIGNELDKLLDVLGKLSIEMEKDKNNIFISFIWNNR